MIQFKAIPPWSALFLQFLIQGYNNLGGTSWGKNRELSQVIRSLSRNLTVQ